MRVWLTMKVEWDKGMETLPEFRGRYDAFKLHVEHMQVKGLLPRGDVNWLITAVKPPIALLPVKLPNEPRLSGEGFIDGPDGTLQPCRTAVGNLTQFRGPACFHTAGNRLM